MNATYDRLFGWVLCWIVHWLAKGSKTFLRMSDNASCADSETIVSLQSVRQLLHEQLANIEFDDVNRDGVVNTISIIVRTLEKVDNLIRGLLAEQKDAQDALSQEEYEELRAKVKDLIRQAAQQTAPKE